MKKTLIFASAALFTCAVTFSTVNSQQNEMSFFITSMGSGDGANLGGLAGADAHCASLAAAAGSMGKTWHAYLSTHATATTSGDIQECKAIRRVFGNSRGTLINNTKSYIGHAMGAAGSLELAGNLPAFHDGVCHPTINVDNLDPECALTGLVINEPREKESVEPILNNSFGMLGINSAVIIRKF